MTLFEACDAQVAGRVTYGHLRAPSGENLAVEARGDVLTAIGRTTGLAFEVSDALDFAADSESRRLCRSASWFFGVS